MAADTEHPARQQDTAATGEALHTHCRALSRSAAASPALACARLSATLRIASRSPSRNYRAGTPVLDRVVPRSVRRASAAWTAKRRWISRGTACTCCNTARPDEAELRPDDAALGAQPGGRAPHPAPHGGARRPALPGGPRGRGGLRAARPAPHRPGAVDGGVRGGAGQAQARLHPPPRVQAPVAGDHPRYRRRRRAGAHRRAASALRLSHGLPDLGHRLRLRRAPRHPVLGAVLPDQLVHAGLGDRGAELPGLLPEYFDAAVENSSELYNYYEWNAKNRASAAQHVEVRHARAARAAPSRSSSATSASWRRPAG